MSPSDHPPAKKTHPVRWTLVAVYAALSSAGESALVGAPVIGDAIPGHTSETASRP